MAREVHSYNKDSIMGEYLEIERYEVGPPTVVAIGDGVVRKKIVEKYPDFNYVTQNFGELHDELAVGKGCIICPGSRITVNVQIGDHVIVNNNATVAHDCVVGDYCTIAPGANLSGNVTLGKLCYIGSNAVIREKISICDEVTIGCGAVVVKNITEPGTYAGNPAKKLKP